MTGEGTPAAPGLYDLQVEVGTTVVQRCRACFTVLTRSAPGLRGPADVVPRVLQRGGTERQVQIHGTSYADGTTVDVLLGTAVDGRVAVRPASSPAQGADIGTRITRTFTVAADAALGFRSLRVTNADGRTSTCEKCLTVTAPAQAVEPTGGTDDTAEQLVVLRVPAAVPPTAKLVLTWVGEGAPAPSRDLVARKALPPLEATFTRTALQGVFDLTRATPGLHTYAAGYVLPDGSRHTCEGTCRFSVRDVGPPSPRTPPTAPLDPDPERAPGVPTTVVRTPTVTAQTAVTVSGTALPGATLDLFTLTSPATSYRLARSAVVPADGRWSHRIAPSADTRLYAVVRNRHGQSRGGVLTVRVSPALTLTAVRTAALTYRLSGSLTPVTPGQRVTLAQVRTGAPVGMISVPVRPNGTFSGVVRLPRGTRVGFQALTAATAVRSAGRSTLTPAVTVR